MTPANLPQLEATQDGYDMLLQKVLVTFLGFGLKVTSYVGLPSCGIVSEGYIAIFCGQMDLLICLHFKFGQQVFGFLATRGRFSNPPPTGVPEVSDPDITISSFPDLSHDVVLSFLPIRGVQVV